MRPIIAPRPTSSATVPSVDPKAATATSDTSATGIPAAIAVPKLTRTSATKACIFSTMMRTRSTPIAAAAMSSSVAEPYAGSMGSMVEVLPRVPVVTSGTR